MSEQATTIIVAVIVAIGSGGLGAAIVNWLANRNKNQAKVDKLLSDIYEKRLTAFADRVTALEIKIEKLEQIIDVLKIEVDRREDMIVSLKQKNDRLLTEIKKLKAESASKDRKIAKLQEQVKELTERLDALIGTGDE